MTTREPYPELGPLSSRTRVEQGLDEGWITPAREAGSVRGPETPLRSERVLEQMIDEDRVERAGS